MRKFAMFSTAMLGLAFFNPSYAQPAQSGPQPGLPPGAGIGAPNAQPPRPTGQVTTVTGAQPAPAAEAPMATSTPAAPVHSHHARHHRVRHHHVTHPAATTAPAAPAAQ